MLDIKMHDDWNPGNWLKEVDMAMDIIEESTAKRIKATAESLVPKRSGDLSRQITIEDSRYRRGGHVVIAQGPGNYDKFYASFVELGTHAKKTDKQTHKMDEQPYLRPALKTHKGKFLADIKNAFKGD